MKFKLKWIKEIILEYSQKEAELVLAGKDMKDPDLERVLDVLVWANQAITNMRPPESEEAKEKQLNNFKIAIEELKKLGVFEKYIDE